MSAAVVWSSLTMDFPGHRLGRRRHRALDAVTLDVEAADFFALIGPNGSGKTTALHCTLGLLAPTAGAARVFGDRLEPGAPAFRDVVYVPEEPHYHDYLTVDEAVRYYAALHGRPASPPSLAAVFERLHIGSARDTLVSACSKGMKQKIGLAQCLLQRPRLLVLDEPMRGLDPVAVREFRDVLTALHRDGVTVLMTSHVLTEVERLATRVAILDCGRLLSVNALDELVTVEHSTYEVEVERLGPSPDYLTVVSSDAGVVRGTLPAAHLYAFMDLARAQGATIRTCGLKKRTLEDSLMATLSEGHHG
jgi:ABC-2 type transport system ATP-binding protein